MYCIGTSTIGRSRVRYPVAATFFRAIFPLPLTSDLCEKVVSGFERMMCKYWCGKARKTWVGALTTMI